MRINIKPESITEEIASALDEIKNGRLKALKDMKDIQVITEALLEHEAKRIEKKFGKEHPRAKQLKIKLKNNLDIIKHLTAESQIARIRIPDIEENDVLIHGRVVDENRFGISGLSVLMIDDEGKPLTTLGKAETDESGYYSLVIDQKTVQEVAKAKIKGVFLTVYSKGEKRIYHEPKPVKIIAGERSFVEVSLTREKLFKAKKTEEKPAKKGVKKPSSKRKELKTKVKVKPEALKLEDIKGIGARRAEKLRRAGIANIENFSEANEAKLRKILGNVDISKMKQESAALLIKTSEASHEKKKE